MAEPTRGDRTNGTSARRRTQAQEEVQPSYGSERLPNTITAGGRTWTVSRHMKGRPHIGITAELVGHVLENWVIRGIKTETDGRQSSCFWAFAPGMRKMVRVAVSMDDRVIITAFQDRAATKSWSKRERSYFVEHYQNLEERDAS